MASATVPGHSTTPNWRPRMIAMTPVAARPSASRRTNKRSRPPGPPERREEDRDAQGDPSPGYPRAGQPEERMRALNRQGVLPVDQRLECHGESGDIRDAEYQALCAVPAPAVAIGQGEVEQDG